MKLVWLWSEVYKGLQIGGDDNDPRKRWVWIGWTKRRFKRRGW